MASLYFKRNMLKCVIICASFFIKEALTHNCEAEDKYPWSYHGQNNGPENWAKNYPACGLKDQSPVEIMYKDIVDVYLAKLKYNNFNAPITSGKVLNLGWTVLMTPEDKIDRFIAWGGETFVLDEIHFHFGSVNDPGAEHVIEGIRYDMEVHYVTHQMTNPSTVAVVASLMKVTSNHNFGFDPIVEVLSEVMYRDNSTNLKSDLNLAGLLPQDSGSYYYYDGSDAIPPCQPRYVWWVLKDIGSIGTDQLATFMSLYSVGKVDASDSCLMGPNFRPLQSLDDRPIMSSQ